MGRNIFHPLRYCVRCKHAVCVRGLNCGCHQRNQAGFVIEEGEAEKETGGQISFQIIIITTIIMLGH